MKKGLPQFGFLLVIALSVAARSVEPTAMPSPTPAPTPTPGPFSLTVLYTNDGWGYTEPCACDPSMGGLARRAAYIKSVREERQNVLLVDAGDSLLTLQRLEDLEQGTLLVAAFNWMGYDAVALGGMDFRMGLDVLREQIMVAEFPVLSANTLDPQTEDFLGEDFVILEKAGHRIAVIGLTDPQMVAEITDGKVPVLEPVERLMAIVDEVKDEVDAIVVLSHLGMLFDINIAQIIPDITLIVSGKDLEVFDPPLDRDGLLIVSAGSRGEFIGRIDLDFDADGNLTSYKAHMQPLTDEIVEDTEMQAWMTQNGMIPAQALKSGSGGQFAP